MNKWWVQAVLFLMVLTGLFFFLGFWEVFFSGPQGIHFMRQTDSLSFASQYFNEGYNFFEPRLFNLKNIEGKAACEFPLTYFLAALLYAVFGKNVLILKLLHFVIVGAGVFLIFRLSYLILKDYFYAVLIALFLYTSTVFNYYAFNYLPDAPALGFTFSGWFFFYHYLKNKKNKSLAAAFILFTFGSLIKVTYLINPLAILVLSLFALIFHKDHIIPQSMAKKIVIAGIAGLLAVLLWNMYMLHYNALYDSNSFNTKALPIWKLSEFQIVQVWDYMSNYWYTKYLAHSSFHFLFVIMVLQVVFFKKSNRVSGLVVLILLSGALSYLILFYAQFKDHDYYFLAFFPFIILVLINGISTLQNISKNRYLHLLTKLILLAIVVAGINYSKEKLNNRFTNRTDEFSNAGRMICENSEAIDSLGISSQAKFVIAPDLCQNGGLFFLNRRGWNIQRMEDITVDRIHHYIDSGADYLLLITTGGISMSVDEIPGELLYIGNGIGIYKLRDRIE